MNREPDNILAVTIESRLLAVEQLPELNVTDAGRAWRLRSHRAENLPLRPWVATEKYEVVEVVQEEVSGRRFELERPWLHARTDL